jgi:hypothetical protein
VASWRVAGTQLEFCNCDPGCACNFNGFPSSAEGNCEGFSVDVIEAGQYDGLDLAGARVASAFWWPGAIHDGGGRAQSFIDCRTDEQFDALSRIWRAEEGGEYFEILTSTYAEPLTISRAAVDVTLDGRRSRFSVDGVGESVMTPLRDPVSGEEHEVRVVVPKGFIWREGDVAQGERMRVDLAGIRFDHAGRHAVVARFEWSNV